MSKPPGEGKAQPYILLITQGNFDVLLAVHVSIILVINQFNAQIIFL